MSKNASAHRVAEMETVVSQIVSHYNENVCNKQTKLCLVAARPILLPWCVFSFFSGGLGMGGWSETSSYNQSCLCSSLPSISIPSSAVQASHTPTHHLTVNTATCYLFLHSHRATALKKTGSLFHGSQTQTELRGRREFDVFFYFYIYIPFLLNTLV